MNFSTVPEEEREESMAVWITDGSEPPAMVQELNMSQAPK